MQNSFKINSNYTTLHKVINSIDKSYIFHVVYVYANVLKETLYVICYFLVFYTLSCDERLKWWIPLSFNVVWCFEVTLLK